MYNVYCGKKLIASFIMLKDARKFISKVLHVDFNRRGFDFVAVTFPRNLSVTPQAYTFGRDGTYVVISISKVL